jgi:hypothetical protein
MSETARHLRVVHNVNAETGELEGCPHCAAAHDEAEVWEAEVLKLKRQLRQALEDKDEKMRADRSYGDALDLIREWKDQCGHPSASEDDPKRIRLALAVIKRYRTKRDALSYVIQHGKHLAFVNDEGHRFDEFGRLFGSSDEIEKRANQWFRHARNRGLDPLTGEPA